MGVATPVFDHKSALIAGIGVVAPTSRISKENVSQVVQPVLEAGQELSRCLGADPGFSES